MGRSPGGARHRARAVPHVGPRLGLRGDRDGLRGIPRLPARVRAASRPPRDGQRDVPAARSPPPQGSRGAHGALHHGLRPLRAGLRVGARRGDAGEPAQHRAALLRHVDSRRPPTRGLGARDHRASRRRPPPPRGGAQAFLRGLVGQHRTQQGRDDLDLPSPLPPERRRRDRGLRRPHQLRPGRPALRPLPGSDRDRRLPRDAPGSPGRVRRTTRRAPPPLPSRRRRVRAHLRARRWSTLRARGRHRGYGVELLAGGGDHRLREPPHGRRSSRDVHRRHLRRSHRAHRVRRL